MRRGCNQWSTCAQRTRLILVDMTHTDASVLTTLTDLSAVPDHPEPDPRRAQRAALRTRHAQGLLKLMDERRDLRGVHALADFVDDAVRWTA